MKRESSILFGIPVLTIMLKIFFSVSPIIYPLVRHYCYKDILMSNTMLMANRRAWVVARGTTRSTLGICFQHVNII